jgi:hypothetical protein
MTPQQQQYHGPDPTTFILRTVDGADRPPVVEKIYGLWMGNVIYLMEPGRRREQFFLRWPETGLAWQEFKDPILKLVENGDLVMCANTDPPDHPEYHLTQGHDGYKPFPNGPTPLVLRYLATPASSAAWRAVLEQRKRQREQAAAARAQFLERVREDVLAQLQVKPRSSVYLAWKLHVSRADVTQVVLEMIEGGKLKGAGRTIWRRYRWAISDTGQAT